MIARTSFAIFALFSVVAAPLTIAQNNAKEASDRVQAVIQKQKERPFWFVLRGQYLTRLPFIYQIAVTRTELAPDGPARTTTSTSWCSAVVEGRSIGDMCRREPAEVKNARRPPRNQKDDRAQRFWEEFRKAFIFEVRELQNRQGRPTTLLSFVPKLGYAPGRNDDTAIFPAIRGQIWIDDMDQEIARFEYEFFKDSAALVFGQVRAGTRYSMDLEKQLDGIWLPTQAATELRLAVMSSTFHEESRVQFGSYSE